MIFENISENALSNIIGQCAQCVQCVIDINPNFSEHCMSFWQENSNVVEISPKKLTVSKNSTFRDLPVIIRKITTQMALKWF